VDISESIYEQFDQRADGGIRCMFIGSGKISQSKTVKVGSHYRLYCAPLVKLASGANVNFVLYSDDFGGTWKVLGGVENSPIPSGGDEPKADELPDGSILVSSRTSGGRIYNIYTFTDVAKGEGSWGTSVWSNANNNGTVATGNSTKGDWACHQIEHELSAEHDVAHGAGLAAVWGSWARYVLDFDPDRFSKLGMGVFGESDPVKTIEKFEEFFRSIDMPTDIKGLGLNFDEAACRTAALGVTFQNARKIGNFKVLDTEDIFNIYMMASGLK
jgi:hypothetical protein